MDVILFLLFFSVVFVVLAALVGGATGKVFFDFVTKPMREDD